MTRILPSMYPTVLQKALRADTSQDNGFLVPFPQVEDTQDTMQNTIYPHKSDAANSLIPENEQILKDQGVDEQIKIQASKKEADRHITDRLMKSSNRSIVSISSVFPWNIYPSTINIEESRVTFIFRQFLASQSHSVDIRDISNVFIESSYFFSTLQIVSRTFIQNDIKIGYLHKGKAVKARTMIEGLRTLLGHNIDTSIYSVKELRKIIGEMHASQGSST